MDLNGGDGKRFSFWGLLKTIAIVHWKWCHLIELFILSIFASFGFQTEHVSVEDFVEIFFKSLGRKNASKQKRSKESLIGNCNVWFWLKCCVFSANKSSSVSPCARVFYPLPNDAGTCAVLKSWTKAITARKSITQLSEGNPLFGCVLLDSRFCAFTPIVPLRWMRIEWNLQTFTTVGPPPPCLWIS